MARKSHEIHEVGRYHEVHDSFTNPIPCTMVFVGLILHEVKREVSSCMAQAQWYKCARHLMVLALAYQRHLHMDEYPRDHVHPSRFAFLTFL